MQIYRGFKSNYYRLCTGIVLFWCFFLFNVQAFAQTTTATTTTDTATSAAVSGTTSSESTSVKVSTKGDKTPTNSDGTRKKTANQGIAQGLSVAETSLLKENPWSFYLSQSAQRGMVEFIDTIDSSTSINLNYRLNSWSSLGLYAGYNSIIYKKGGDLFYNQDPDPQQYGFDDTEISYVLPNVWSDKYNRLVISNALTLPTSRASSRSSMNVAVRSSMSLRYRPMSKVIITPSLGAYARQFSYDTASEFGFVSNSPFGINYSLSGSYVFTQWLTGSVSYGQTQRYDYNGDWRVIQSAGATLSVSVDAFNLYVGYSWRDKVLTNESLFDNDRSLIYTGVGYAF